MTPEQERVLQETTIDENGPGTILRDFETLIRFIGADGVATGGKRHFLPMSALRELDEQMTHPLRPQLKRPQQHSFPHIHGLYLLLRTTRLGVSEGQGRTSKLVLDPLMLEQWQKLNATERYFNLLEAWLVHAKTEILGGPAGFGDFGGDATDAQLIWQLVTPKQPGTFKPIRDTYFAGAKQGWRVALFELFGLLEVERGKPQEGVNWPIKRVKRTFFGDALTALVIEDIEVFFDVRRARRGVFGVYRKHLVRWFPQWRQSLGFLAQAPREGVLTFKVSLDRAWRRFALDATASLDTFADEILSAFDFDFDHLYEFRLRDRDGTSLEIFHPAVEDAYKWADETTIGELPLDLGQTMRFVYDFGDNWQFTIKLEKIDESARLEEGARLIESRGEAPPQYAWDEDEDEEDDEGDW